MDSYHIWYEEKFLKKNVQKRKQKHERDIKNPNYEAQTRGSLTILTPSSVKLAHSKEWQKQRKRCLGCVFKFPCDGPCQKKKETMVDPLKIIFKKVPMQKLPGLPSSNTLSMYLSPEWSHFQPTPYEEGSVWRLSIWRILLFCVPCLSK